MKAESNIKYLKYCKECYETLLRKAYFLTYNLNIKSSTKINCIYNVIQILMIQNTKIYT